MSSSQRKQQVPTEIQPKTYKPTLKALLYLPVCILRKKLELLGKRLIMERISSFVSATLHPLLEKSDRAVVSIQLEIDVIVEVHSVCQVTPLLEVRLQDVLDRKHLPPLGTCILYI